MQIILIISTFWKANSTMLKICTLWTFTRVFVLPSVYLKVKGDVGKSNIPQLTTNFLKKILLIQLIPLLCSPGYNWLLGCKHTLLAHAQLFIC